MKSTLLLLFSVLSLTGCKKFIENQQEQAALEIVTSGRWQVTQYKKGSENLTALFTDYAFQFRENETVEAYKSNALQATGTWKVDVPNKTITSGFSTTEQPLALLNGMWQITNSTMTTVAASQTINGEIRVLKLLKI